MTTDSQRSQILSDLKRGDSLTAVDALQRYGCFRLAARIREIRDMGYPVETQLERHEGGRHARYFLKANKRK